MVANNAPNGTKERIQHAAVELFTQKGYARTTTAAIAKQAGVNELTLFRIFGNKKALLYDVYFLLTPVADNVDLNGLTHGKNLEKDLRVFFQNYLELHIKHMPAYRLSLQMQEEVYDRDLYYASFANIQGMITQFTEYLIGMAANGIIPGNDFASIAEFMFSLFLIKALELTNPKSDFNEYDKRAANAFVKKYAKDIKELLRQNA